ERGVDIAVLDLFGGLREVGVLFGEIRHTDRVEDLGRVDLCPAAEVAGVDRRSAEGGDRIVILATGGDDGDGFGIERGDPPEALDGVVFERVDPGPVFGDVGDIVLNQREICRPVRETADVFYRRSGATLLEANIDCRLTRCHCCN